MSHSRRPLGTGPSRDQASEPARAARGRTAAERAGAAPQPLDPHPDPDLADDADLTDSGRRRLGAGPWSRQDHPDA
ncbi:hypothetical protein ACIHCV_35820 [Streptomyces sp. NPDC051956]|uniref:hypothetical protein n=1 Tax=Streptomyces sp. NPDC051956 TaxID=3365677 RepID=UPI0037D2790D